VFTGKGDLFGSDLAYLDDEEETIAKSTSDVKALTYCDLQCMSLSGLKQALRMYPELAKQCATDLLHDLTYNLRDGFIDPDDDTIDIPAVTLQHSNTPTTKVYSHMFYSSNKTPTDGFFSLIVFPLSSTCTLWTLQVGLETDKQTYGKGKRQVA